MQPSELRVVYSTSDANEAEILRVALQDEGIPCEIDGEGQAGLTGIGVMKINLLVKAEDFERADAFIESHENKASDSDDS